MTSTNPSQQFSAPFKAANSRQLQICVKATQSNYNIETDLH